LASWQVIEFTGQTLVRVLEQHLSRVLPGNNIDVQVASAALFEQFGQTTQPAITLFLYRIIENPEMRNGPPRDLGNGVMRQPLPLELCYMVTPWSVRAQQTVEVDAVATQEEHRLLGAIMQAFYDHSEVSRAQLVDQGLPVWTPVDSIQIIIESPPVEDLYRIWDSTELVYRTSLTYRARVMGLDPLETIGSSRVIHATFTSGET
jgi:hypothetical protein